MSLDLYNQYRKDMATGDLILWRSDTLLGKAIRFFSKGDVNHAGLVIRLDEYGQDRVYTLEALEHGIVLRALSERLTNHKGECYWFSLIDHYILRRFYIGRNALELVGTKYDYGSLFRQLLGRVSTDASRFFCSEYVAKCWFDAGIPVNIVLAPRPGDMEHDFRDIIKGRVQIL